MGERYYILLCEYVNKATSYTGVLRFRVTCWCHSETSNCPVVRRRKEDRNRGWQAVAGFLYIV